MEKMFWGIDGCKKGWIAIGLADDDEFLAVYTPSIEDLWEEYGHLANCILIDMPIGLSDNPDGRLAEKTARGILGKRRSSVFNVPSLSAINYGTQYDFSPEAYRPACEINYKIEGKKFSVQSWNISPKIHEVNRFLVNTPSAQSILLESHPEVLFWALNQKIPMKYSKKAGLGFMERLNLLTQYQANAQEIIQQTYDSYSKFMLDDDIADALVCAVCARLGNLNSLPENPPQNHLGLSMQMIYPRL